MKNIILIKTNHRAILLFVSLILKDVCCWSVMKEESYKQSVEGYIEVIPAT